MSYGSSESLLIVGASVRAAAQSAVNAGFRVWGADLFADTDLYDIANATVVTRYPAELLSYMAKAPDVPWLYTGALENYPALIERLSRQRTLWGNSAEVVRRVRNPLLLSEMFPYERVSFPRTMQADAQLGAQHFEPDQWLIKEHRSGGGGQVSWLDDPRQLKQPGRRYLQKFVSGVPCSAVFVAAQGRAVLLGVTRQLIGEPWLHATGFHYCGSIGPIPLHAYRTSNLQPMGEILAKEFSLVGLFGVDYIQEFGGAGTDTVIEVNPRYTASMELLERTFASPIIALHAAACTEGVLPDPASLRLPGRKYFAKGILFARADTHFRAEVFDYVRQQNFQRQWPAIADVPRPGTPITRGQPIVTLFSEGTDEPSAEKGLRQAVIDFEQVLYRE